MVRPPLRLAALLATAVAVLAACGGSEPPQAVSPASGAGLETVAVSAGTGEGERVFDGIVEAVQQATIAAQTAGRIVALERDVDDPVGRGELILRISGVEQRARLNEARQALTEARAMATEARSRYTRVSELAADHLLDSEPLL